MGTIRTIYHIARADLLERIRQYGFMVTLGITMLAAYFFVPPGDAGYATLYLDVYRGVYNSAWVGASVALSTTFLLSLLGFYLVKNSIERDERTGVGQIVASTSVKKLYYMAGKWISNFTVLSIIVMVVIVMAIVMQLVRGEVMKVELWPLLSPFLFITLPMMALVAALALLFETPRYLRGLLGNIIYFFLFIMFTTGTSYLAFGTTIITSDMIHELTRLIPDFTGSYSIGILIIEQPLKLFEWQGIEWTGAILFKQLMLFPAAFLLILAAALLFRGFRESSALQKGEKGKEKSGIEADNAEIRMEEVQVIPAPRIRTAALTAATGHDSFLALVLAEWRLMMKSASPGWYIVAAILAILCLAVPVADSAQWMIAPVTWIWPLMFWSGIGSRENRCQTEYLVATSPRFASRQLSAVWLAGVLLTCTTGSGLLLRLIMEGNIAQLAHSVAAVILIPSLALASGVLTKTNRTFEVLYMIIWYLGPFNKMPFLDFLGTNQSAGTSWIMSSVYIVISLGLLLLAYAFRRRLVHSL